MEVTNSTGSTSEEVRKRHIYSMVFRITLVLCSAIIIVVTAVLVIMVIYAKYKGWRSSSPSTIAALVKGEEKGEPTKDPTVKQPITLGEIADNPYNP